MNVATITENLWSWLEEENLDEFVEEILKWANPQTVGLDPGAHRHNFEVVAGSLDRLGNAIASMTTLAKLEVDATQGLLAASDELRGLYRRIVAYVLLEVDSAAWDRDEEASLVDWDDLDDMAAALVELHDVETVSIYTLNYDSLLMSALLEQSKRVYDGFRWLEANEPLEPWGNITLYPLHGGIGIYADSEGEVRKRRLDDVREEELLERWVEGEDNGEIPQVILGDTKDSAVLHRPFSTHYGQLSADLALPYTREVVVGGYGFGDRPVNRALGLFLAADEHRRLLDWRPRATQEVGAVLRALREPLSDDDRKRITAEQILAEDIALPSADAVRALGTSDAGS
ncbi:hypothetical protein M3B43_10160 [Nesterenkonia massiliensis]|uniref:SIR2-like domain-containing protein n=1 Tax=Nesterenkonia massiliensis TaxID=1232429 RepID=A0ABT2HSK6_9MICC|nr:hypothetical protein [Nesterenkonia massiliensis]MCT1607673.1 hypothetical protein [Nesterenkonia massiliensis]